MQEKGAVTPKETDPDLPMSVQESLAETWVINGLLQGQGHSVPSTLQQTTTNPHLCWRLLDTHRQVWVSLL